MTFMHPWLLLLLLLIPLAAVWHLGRERVRRPSLLTSSREELSIVRLSYKSLLKLWLSPVLLALAVAAAVVALARPIAVQSEQEVHSEGIDIVLALDLSGSMQAQDLKPNRLDAARAVAADFIRGRGQDRLGLVVFAGEAYTKCPLTLDHDLLLSQLDQVEIGEMEDGTAVGLALATGVNRLRESDAKSRVLILLTDGENNRGIDPRTALDLAITEGITVHTIGVGRDGMAPIPVQTPFGTRLQNIEAHIDEELLREIATKTGGRYFRAHDLSELKAVYEQIDKLERSEIEVTEYRLVEERFAPWLQAAVLLLACAMMLSLLMRRQVL